MPTKSNSFKSFFVDSILHINAKIILFLSLAIMTIVVIAFIEFPLITVDDASHQRLVSMGWLLFPHIFFGCVGFLSGPLQFSSRLRKQNIKLHRTLGKIYVFSIFLASVFAVFTNLKYPIPGQSGASTVEAMTQPAVWFITTLIAWLCAMRKQITLHKIWMSRSYAVTFVFVSSRVILVIPFFANLDFNTFVTVLWFLIVVALIVPEILLNWKEIFVSRKKATAKVITAE